MAAQNDLLRPFKKHAAKRLGNVTMIVERNEKACIVCDTARLHDKGNGSLPAPVGHEVAAGLRELALIGTVGQHGPDLAMPADGALEDDVAAIGRPRREVVASRLVSDLEPLQRRRCLVRQGLRGHTCDSN